MGWLIDQEEELILVYFSDRTITICEQKHDPLPIPSFAQSFNLTENLGLKPHSSKTTS
jgi:hypothetical protein